MSLMWIIIIAVIALAAIIAISYMFRDAFFLFEGIAFICDALGEALSNIDFGDMGDCGD